MKLQSSKQKRDRFGLDSGRSAAIAACFERVRGQTCVLAQPLSPEDCALQSMPDASPVKWHLAHTSWFFETFVLEPNVADYQPFNPQFRVLFNSYYVAIGPRHPRPERGILSRPAMEEVLAYRRHVDTHMARLLDSRALAPALLALVEMGIHHEQQHQELILTDLKHLLSRNPLKPVYVEPVELAETSAAAVEFSAAGTWLELPDGIRQIGHAVPGFSFDNEQPRHRVFIDACAIASQPVTNAEYAGFIADRGYERPELWLSEGWELKSALGWSAPLYWETIDGRWRTFTLNGLRPLEGGAPVCHVSFFEADAYARWAQSRLPTEAEWETLAAPLPVTGNFLESGAYRPLPQRAGGVPAQVYGDVWEWTRSAYEPYPGYRIAPGAVGEYNGKFMSNQYVLRGGSCATPASHIRATYRNFFPAAARWQFSGIRLARDRGRKV